MTKEQKEEIQRLLEAGMSYQAVGERFGVSKQRIHQITHPKPRKIKSPELGGIKYPGLKKYMEENGLSVFSLSVACGRSSSAVLWRSLKGDGGMNKSTIDAILKVTGLTYEEAFSEEENVE